MEIYYFHRTQSNRSLLIWGCILIASSYWTYYNITEEYIGMTIVTGIITLISLIKSTSRTTLSIDNTKIIYRNSYLGYITSYEVWINDIKHIDYNDFSRDESKSIVDARQYSIINHQNQKVFDCFLSKNEFPGIYSIFENLATELKIEINKHGLYDGLNKMQIQKAEKRINYQWVLLGVILGVLGFSIGGFYSWHEQQTETKDLYFVNGRVKTIEIIRSSSKNRKSSVTEIQIENSPHIFEAKNTYAKNEYYSLTEQLQKNDLIEVGIKKKENTNIKQIIRLRKNGHEILSLTNRRVYFTRMLSMMIGFILLFSSISIWILVLIKKNKARLNTP